MIAKEERNYLKTGLKSLWILGLIISFSSCDPVYEARISNMSDQEILLEIQYDKSSLPPYWDSKYFILSSQAASEIEGGTVISTDSINWILKFKLEPNEHFTLENGMGNKPSFKIIKSIHILDKDTIILNRKEKMFDLFKNIKDNIYEFGVK